VPGGGVALLRAKKAVGKLTNEQMPTCKPASTYVIKAIEAPLRQIAENSGVEGSIVVKQDPREQVGDLPASTRRPRKYGDMLEKGIVDPAKVVRRGIARCSLHRPAFLVTTEAMVGEMPKEQSAMPAMPPGGGGMGGMGGMGFLIALPIVNPKGAVQTAPFFLLPWRRAA